MSPSFPPPVTIASLAAALIGTFEGMRLTAYQDTGGIWTIGIGHTGPNVVEGLSITVERAQELFAEDQAPLLAKVVGRSVLEGAALVSFGFNCGMAALEKVLAGTATLDQFVHDRKGNVLAGLVSRRTLEGALMALSRQPSEGE